jgi:hypothetical protein
VIFRLLLVDKYYFLKNVDNPFEVNLSYNENVELGTLIDEFNIFLLNLVIQLVE